MKKAKLVKYSFMTRVIDDEGVVYDLFDKDGEHIESYGYDFYYEIKNIEKDLDN